MNAPLESGGKIDLGIDLEQAEKLLESYMQEVANQYDAVTENDPEAFSRPGVFADRFFPAIKIPGEMNLTLLANKYWRTTQPNPIDDGSFPKPIAEQKEEKVQFMIVRGNPQGTSRNELRETWGTNEEVASFHMLKKDHGWAITHRDVKDKYREQGVGGLFMKGIFAFAQAHANKNQKPEKLTVNLGQPSVLAFFDKYKFTPRTLEDTKRAQAIASRSSDLVVANSQIHTVDMVGNLSKELVAQTWKDPYVFHKNTSGRTERDAYRLELEKTFTPEGRPTEISHVEAGIRTQIENSSHD